MQEPGLVNHREPAVSLGTRALRPGAQAVQPRRPAAKAAQPVGAQR